MDADGKKVPTHYELRGDVLVQVVDHRSSDVAYPVTADPWWNTAYHVAKCGAAIAFVALTTVFVVGKALKVVKAVERGATLGQRRGRRDERGQAAGRSVHQRRAREGPGVRTHTGGVQRARLLRDHPDPGRLLLMEPLILLTWSAMALVTTLVITVALALWVRDLVRDRGLDGPEPSPISERVVPFMLLSALVLAAVRLLQGDPVSFTDTVFPAVFIGFGLSAGWYLLDVRSSGLRPRTVDQWSVAIAASFGVLSGLAMS